MYDCNDRDLANTSDVRLFHRGHSSSGDMEWLDRVSESVFKRTQTHSSTSPFQEKPVLRSDNTVFGFNVVIAPKRNSLQGMI